METCCWINFDAKSSSGLDTHLASPLQQTKTVLRTHAIGSQRIAYMPSNGHNFMIILSLNPSIAFNPGLVSIVASGMLPIGKVAVAGGDTGRPPYCMCTMLNNLRISGRITQLKQLLYTYTRTRRVPWYGTSAMGHLCMKMEPLWPCGCAAAARQCRTEHLGLCTSRATSIRRVLFDTILYYI